ncbi:flagellar motor switch protein FliG [Rhodobacteraceae bacterium WD3A24]|nr:flagellar motor switch protein FliG [Rhodobacteraceae bacterium WD3A24]
MLTQQGPQDFADPARQGTEAGADATLRAGAAAGHGGGARRPAALSGRQKAAIIVRLLLAEGASLRLSDLPEHMQAALTEQMGTMRLVDRATLRAVVDEFLDEIESVGLSFPGGIDGAISMLGGHISDSATTRLRRLAGTAGKADPWRRIAEFDTDRLLPILENESVEIGAVVLSKTAATTAARLLERLPGEKARRIACAVSLTGKVDPETVRRIGVSLLAQLEAQPPRAFVAEASARMGEILTSSPSETREHVLAGLSETDPDFADRVRRAIFTFAHIPRRLGPGDVAKVARRMEPDDLVIALKGAQPDEDARAAGDHILANISQRLAEAIREQVAEHGAVKPRDGEAAMARIVELIRAMAADGEIELLDPDDDDAESG